MRNLLGFPESKDDGLGKPHCGNGVWGMGSCMAWSLGNKAWTNLMVGGSLGCSFQWQISR